MKCNKCGIELSPKVWRIHVKKCNVQEEVQEEIKEEVQEIDEDSIRAKAKELGIGFYWNMNIDKLIAKIEEVE